LVVAYLNRATLLAQALQISFNRSVAVARDALQRCKPDVVVGFSWGGAIAIELIRSGDWKGPTVLLAPAHKKLDQLMRSVGVGVGRWP
jgi:dienelactone hydrolase